MKALSKELIINTLNSTICNKKDGRAITSNIYQCCNDFFATNGHVLVKVVYKENHELGDSVYFVDSNKQIKQHELKEVEHSIEQLNRVKLKSEGNTTINNFRVNGKYLALFDKIWSKLMGNTFMAVDLLQGDREDQLILRSTNPGLSIQLEILILAVRK